MADECADVSTIEEMSVLRWLTTGAFHRPEAIYTALVECLKEKYLQVSNIVGTGFDGASTLSEKKTGVQTRNKKIAPYASFVHCHCHLLQLACVQAANATNGIKYVYVTLISLWMFFRYSPKRALRMVQQVLDLPELKIAKPSDTRWLAHEWCVRAVKGAIINSLNDMHNNSHGTGS